MKLVEKWSKYIELVRNEGRKLVDNWSKIGRGLVFFSCLFRSFQLFLGNCKEMRHSHSQWDVESWFILFCSCFVSLQAYLFFWICYFYTSLDTEIHAYSFGKLCLVRIKKSTFDIISTLMAFWWDLIKKLIRHRITIRCWTNTCFYQFLIST